MNAIQQIIAAQTESGRIVCPKCGPDRKHHNPTLSITVEPDRTLYLCHHCSFKGAITFEGAARLTNYSKRVENITPIPTKLNADNDAILQFFAARGVEVKSLDGLPATTTDERYFGQLNSKKEAIGFVYGDPKNPTAIKWRPLDGTKAFMQDGCAAELYGLERLPKGIDTLVVVEGESDAIALWSIGVPCVSVPNGAPMKPSARRHVGPEDDKKFAYVWEARELFQSVKRVILATDGDEAGDALAEEIARRVDRAKCWRPEYPEGCKDITDVIRKSGAEAARTVINKSQAMPLQGVYSANTYHHELLELYRDGFGKGQSTGYPLVDELFTIKEGMLYVVTGYPGSGKSEFVDQIMVNLAINKHWKFAVASFENPPAIHVAKLAEKIVGKPFHEGVVRRMSHAELSDSTAFINDHFVFLESRDGKMPTVGSIIDRTKQAVMRLGVRGLVIDPYNYIQMEQRDKEHQSISDMLSEISTFAKAHSIAIFFVAHPIKIYPGEDGKQPVPKGNHISGSAAWFAKADIGLTVHRGDIGSDIHCWKSRFKWLGKIGQTTLGYDVVTGRYFERVEELPTDDWTAPPAPSHWADGKGAWDM